MIFAKIIHRKSDTLNSIALSLLIILIFNPFAIKDVGLELSYLGTLGIVLLNTPISKFLSKYINEKLELLMHSNDIDYLNLFYVLNKNEDYLTKGNNIYITNEGNIAIFNKLYRKIDQLYLHKQR